MRRTIQHVFILLIITMMTTTIAAQSTINDANQLRRQVAQLDKGKDSYLIRAYDYYLNDQTDSITLDKMEHFLKIYSYRSEPQKEALTERLMGAVCEHHGDTAQAAQHYRAAFDAQETTTYFLMDDMLYKNLTIIILAVILAFFAVMLFISYVRRSRLDKVRDNAENAVAQANCKLQDSVTAVLAENQHDKETLIRSFLSSCTDEGILNATLSDIIGTKQCDLSDKSLLVLIHLCLDSDTDTICDKVDCGRTTFYRLRTEVLDIISADKNAKKAEIIAATAAFLSRL